MRTSTDPFNHSSDTDLKNYMNLYKMHYKTILFFSY